MVQKLACLSVATALCIGTCLIQPARAADQPAKNIRLNQVGFLPDGPKRAVVIADSNDVFSVLNAESGDTVFTGRLGIQAAWAPSQENARLADFSALKTPGTYQIDVPGIGKSGAFRIDTKVYGDLFQGLSRYYYYNRASITLTSELGGRWARELGHPDNQVRIHSSAVSEGRAEGALIDASGGWYDAGDYNKYMGPTAVTVATLLNLYEDASGYLKNVDLKLPESGNAIPDILNESLWGLRLLMRCQDPVDGGVYHKITSADFSGFVAPAKDKSTRYAVIKSVTATYDVAAVLAKAARVFRPFEKQVPGFADSALAAARKAWIWALAHPTQTYDQTKMNKSFTPAIATGEYGDGQAGDEKFWAGIELGLTTGENAYLDTVHSQATLTGNFGIPGWGAVNSYALFSLASRVAAGDSLPARFKSSDVIAKITNLAKPYLTRRASSSFGVGLNTGDFNWGSNGTIAAQGVVLLMNYRLTADTAYKNAAIDWLDYLVGRNGTGYSYVTGFGWKPAMNPHHRPSGSDNVADPVPGMLVGGPNSGVQDSASGCVYASRVAALAYTDNVNCYASNEVAIYWNAPAVYLTGLLSAMADGQTLGIQVKERGAKRSELSPMGNRQRHNLGKVFYLKKRTSLLGRVETP